MGYKLNIFLKQQLFVANYVKIDLNLIHNNCSTCLFSAHSYYIVYVGKPTKDSKSAEQLLNRMNHDENHVLKPKEKRFSIISL